VTRRTTPGCEIRTLPDSDLRLLIRIAWLHRVGRRLHESNHYQIALWDTVDGILDPSQRRQIQRGSLFDACRTQQLCHPSTVILGCCLHRKRCNRRTAGDQKPPIHEKSKQEYHPQEVGSSHRYPTPVPEPPLALQPPQELDTHSYAL